MKKFKAILMALTLGTMMVSSSFALDTNSSSNNNVIALRQANNEQTVKGRIVHGIGLSLDAGKSGTSFFKFAIPSVPSNARIRKVKINPGSTIIRNGNNRNILGAVLMENVELTSPDGNTERVAWNPKGMEITGSFLEKNPRGQWTGVVSGRNISRATGNPTMDLRFFGSTIYKNAEVEITYITE